MEPISAALILAGLAASSAAAVYTNKKNIEYAQDANDASIALANTAHQREVRDLRAAGLNPILSASGGGSAVPTLKVPDLSNPLSDAGTSARDLASSLNGTTAAERDILKSEASSARDYAEMAERENTFDALAKERQAYEDAAAIAAFDGDSKVRTYGDNRLNKVFAYESEPWQELRDTFRKQIETGNYESSRWRAITDDVFNYSEKGAGVLFSGARSLKDLKGIFKPTPKGRRR